MTNRITISASYTCVVTGSVDLSPKTWGDVKDWYIKWGMLYVQFEGDESWVEFDIESGWPDDTDWKRPDYVDIYEGEFKFEKELASQ
jgi:hypothetical protein